jgi:tetratricopeptide (TPR) repeat protein
MRKTVALWEQLEQNTPDVYRPKLAHGLVGLFTILNAIGRYLEAENKIRKATEIFCLLAADSPELFNPECAGALHSTPQVLVDQKRNSEALRVLNEAAAIYAPSPELVTVHQDRRICCTHLKKFSEAVEAASCAIETLKQVETKDDELTSRLPPRPSDSVIQFIPGLFRPRSSYACLSLGSRSTLQHPTGLR